MLPVNFRLSHKKAFALIFKEGSYASLGALSLKWRPTHLSRSAVGFIASKKNFPKAVNRNRAKRVLREAMRSQLFALRPGFAIIVLYRYKPETLTYDAIERDLRLLLKKNNLLHTIS